MDERNDYNSIPLQPTQTAVEWLECELKKIPFINVIEVFERAKQMEKEQITKAFIHNRYVLAGGYPTRTDEAEEYYNQTYNQINKL